MDASPAVLRGLLFDFDGTIAETERFGHRVAYNRAFAELGLDWSWDEALYGELLAVAGGQERLRHFVETRRPDQAGIAGAEGFYERVHRVKGEHFARLAAEVPLRPGVLRLVAEAQAAGIAVGIATTAARAGVDALLELHPVLAAAVATIVAGEDVPRKKPAPDAYLVAMERLGLVAPECVAFEDSHVGLQAALAAGLSTVVTPSDYTAGEDFSGAAAVLPDLGGVEVDFVRELLRSARERDRQPLQPAAGHGE
jgi:HAD superfamily hydrolase (TIGR01509 family)